MGDLETGARGALGMADISPATPANSSTGADDNLVAPSRALVTLELEPLQISFAGRRIATVGSIFVCGDVARSIEKMEKPVIRRMLRKRAGVEDGWPGDEMPVAQIDRARCERPVPALESVVRKKTEVAEGGVVEYGKTRRRHTVDERHIRGEASSDLVLRQECAGA